MATSVAGKIIVERVSTTGSSVPTSRPRRPNGDPGRD
jgi:hypothetical protein